MALGSASAATGSSAVALGSASAATGSSAVALGYASAAHDRAVAIGWQAEAYEPGAVQFFWPDWDTEHDGPLSLRIGSIDITQELRELKDRVKKLEAKK